MLGIIGGTGLYRMDGVEVLESREVSTPFGSPSAPVTLGKVGEAPVAFLPRHGTGHGLLPSDINYRANIYALKSVGVRRVISVSACGSLRQEIAPGDLVAPTQYFDWTRGRRASTYFGDGLVAHASTAEPVCAALVGRIARAADKTNSKLHTGKTYACVEGPRLGTRAESFFLRGAGCDIVGMTNVPEAFLAREAQLCYSTLAIATDYDCWLDDPAQHASADQVVALYMKNIARVQEILQHVVQADAAEVRAGSREGCLCSQSLRGALMCAREQLKSPQLELLEFLEKT